MIVVVFGLVLGLGIETKTVADIASISGGFPHSIFQTLH
jgi:SulP family sulfate permease